MQRVPEFVARQSAAVAQLCAAHHVARLELFGSGARADFDPTHSDLDFLVEFLPVEPRALADAYFEFVEQLEALFGRPVDLVSPREVRNRYLRAAIDRDRVLLYAA